MSDAGLDKVGGDTIYSPEIEQCILGMLIEHSSVLSDFFSKISDFDFYTDDNKALFKAINQVRQNNETVETFLLTEYYSKIADISPTLASNNIHSCTNCLPDYDDNGHVRKVFSGYYKILKSNSAYRTMSFTARDIIKSKDNKTPEEMIGFLTTLSSKFLDTANQIVLKEDKTKNISELTEKYVEDMMVNLDKGETSGVHTGFDIYDDATLGYHAGDFIVTAGRPSMGKTAFTLQRVLNIALKGYPIIFFSVEMPADQLVARLLAVISGVDSMKIRSGEMSSNEWASFKNAVKTLRSLPLFIDDENSTNISEIRQKVSKWHAENVATREDKKGIIMADYLQIIGDEKAYENKNTNERVGRISKSSKAIAREFKVPFIMLSQLNRTLEQRPNKRPINSDLRDSGGIEQDADIIEFIYRDEVYNKETAVKGEAELIIGKQRNGPLGTLFLQFDGPSQQFTAQKFVS